MCQKTTKEDCKTCRDFSKERKIPPDGSNDSFIKISTRNIAEGYGRYHYQENILQAISGSLAELKNDLTTAYEEQYIDKQKLKYLSESYRKMQPFTYCYIAYLKRTKNEYQTQEDETAYEVFTNNE